MSSPPSIPKIVVVFNEGQPDAVTPPQGDVFDLILHLGCTKEVNSFEMLLQNWDGQYAKATETPITVGMTAKISIGRDPDAPLYFTGEVEEIETRDYAEEDKNEEHFIVVKGRCTGRELFDRLVTKRYENQKGEAIVKDIIDNFTNLSHVRNTIELVEDTDTTFTEVEFVDKPVFEAIKFIAENSDKAGVIGFDFRIEYDGKFAFFPVGSKTSPVSLTDTLAYGAYKRSVSRKRQRVWVRGAAAKKDPADTDEYTDGTAGKESNDLNTYTSTDSTQFVLKSTITMTPASGKSVKNYQIRLEAGVDIGTGQYAISYEVQGDVETQLGIYNVTNTAWEEKVHNVAIYGGAGKWVKIRFYVIAPAGGTIGIRNMRCFWDELNKHWESDGDGVIRLLSGVIGNVAVVCKGQTTITWYVALELKMSEIGNPKLFGAEAYKKLIFEWKADNFADASNYVEYLQLQMREDSSNYYHQYLNGQPLQDSGYREGTWTHAEAGVGYRSSGWSKAGTPHWENITSVYIKLKFNTKSVMPLMDLFVDGFYFDHGRFSAMSETSPSATRELALVDEELYSDAECSLRAQAIRDYRKSPFDFCILDSDVLDYGTNRLQAGDKIAISLPNIGLNTSLRMSSIEIRASGKDASLSVHIEAGRESPLLADYIYSMRERVRKSMRYKVES